MRKFAIVAVLLFAYVAGAGAIHSWSTGEYITSTDLNAALGHLHANLGHGHGPILINSDISTGAAIAHSKLATPALVPKSWYTVGAAACSAATCTAVDSSVITSVSRSGAGLYVANFPTRGDANYGVLLTSHTAASNLCWITARTATTASFSCALSSVPGTPVDASFTVLILDSSN
jgi:hypothetical protein